MQLQLLSIKDYNGGNSLGIKRGMKVKAEFKEKKLRM